MNPFRLLHRTGQTAGRFDYSRTAHCDPPAIGFLPNPVGFQPNFAVMAPECQEKSKVCFSLVLVADCNQAKPRSLTSALRQAPRLHKQGKEDYMKEGFSSWRLLKVLGIIAALTAFALVPGGLSPQVASADVSIGSVDDVDSGESVDFDVDIDQGEGTVTITVDGGSSDTDLTLTIDDCDGEDGNGCDEGDDDSDDADSGVSVTINSDDLGGDITAGLILEVDCEDDDTLTIFVESEVDDDEVTIDCNADGDGDEDDEDDCPFDEDELDELDEDELDDAIDESDLDEDEFDEVCDFDDEDDEDDRDVIFRDVPVITAPQVIPAPRVSAPAPAPAPVAAAPAPAPQVQLPRTGEGPSEGNGSNGMLPIGAAMILLAGAGLAYWRLARTR
jgi:hypothetical protein